MRKTTITISFNAPGAEEGKLSQCSRGETEISHKVSGDIVTFVVQHRHASPIPEHRDLILGYAAALSLLLPEDSDLVSVEPVRIDGQDLARELQVSPSVLMQVGIEIFRRSANDVGTVFSAIGTMRSSGHPAMIPDSLSDKLAYATDTNCLNGQISRGLSRRLLAEGGADIGMIEIPGIGQARISGEGHMAHVVAEVYDDEMNTVSVTSDGTTVKILTGDAAFSTSGLMKLSALMEASAEILREEASRFDAHLRDWANPVIRRQENGETEIMLGTWDGVDVCLLVTRRGEVFSENLPFCFPPDIISLDSVISVFGEGRVAEMVSEAILSRNAA